MASHPETGEKSEIMRGLLFLFGIIIYMACHEVTSHSSTPAFPAVELNGDEMEGDLPNGTYRFVIIVGGAKKAIRPVGGVKAENNALVEQRDFTMNNNGHEWKVFPLGNGNYNILLQNTDKALTALGTASPSSGTPLGVKALSENQSNQIWKIEYTGSHIYKIKLASKTDLAVNISPVGSTENGAVFQLRDRLNNNSSFLVYRTSYKDIQASNFFKRTSGWMHGDGANTVALNNGTVLWLMDDGGIDAWDPETGTVPCGFQTNNSILLQPKGNWSPSATRTLLGPMIHGKSSLFRSEPATTNYNWISTGFQLGDIVRVYCSTLEPPVNDTNRNYWGKYSISSNSIIDFTRLPSNVESGPISWGNGFVVETDGFVYAYGAQQDFISANVFVARFPQSKPDGAWAFWNGSAWVSNINETVAIGNSASPVPFVSKIIRGGVIRYLIVSSEFSAGCGGGSRIFTSSSASPTGPFSARKEIYNHDDRLDGHTPFFYWAKAHPEYINDDNELLITYDINGYGKMFDPNNPAQAPCVETCKNGRTDPDHYRPRGVRVPLGVIDSAFSRHY